MSLYLISYKKPISLLLVVLATILINSCEPAFSPIQENDQYYSVFGFLNASADTQFIRIEEIRDSLFSDTPSELDARIKLTNVTLGQSVFLKDSLFHYYLEGKAHNYYTTTAINPTERYRLEIIEGGTKTKAEVVIPATFPPPELISGNRLKITGIDRLIGVKMIYSVFPNCQPDPRKDNCPEEPPIFQHGFQHLADTTHVGNGIIHADINPAEDLQEVSDEYGPLGFTLVKAKVVVAAGSSSWPDFIGLDAEEIAVPGTNSNIDGGVGLLGGVVTDTLVICGRPEKNRC